MNLMEIIRGYIMGRTSVFIGRNGAGKSNLLEAIIIIFRDLDLNVQTKEFSYSIR